MISGAINFQINLCWQKLRSLKELRILYLYVLLLLQSFQLYLEQRKTTTFLSLLRIICLYLQYSHIAENLWTLGTLIHVYQIKTSSIWWDNKIQLTINNYNVKHNIGSNRLQTHRFFTPWCLLILKGKYLQYIYCQESSITFTSYLYIIFFFLIPSLSIYIKCVHIWKIDWLLQKM